MQCQNKLEIQDAWISPLSDCFCCWFVFQWDLVCDRAWLVELSMSMQAVGKMIAALIFNHMSDKYGRKMVFLCCFWTNIIIASTRAFSPNMIMYSLLVFFGGMVQQVSEKMLLVKYLGIIRKHPKAFSVMKKYACERYDSWWFIYLIITMFWYPKIFEISIFFSHPNGSYFGPSSYRINCGWPFWAELFVWFTNKSVLTRRLRLRVLPYWRIIWWFTQIIQWPSC